jgi:hypothetical protein
MISRHYAAYVRVGPAYKFAGVWEVGSGEEDIEFALASRKLTRLGLRKVSLIAVLEVGSHIRGILFGFVFHAEGETGGLKIIDDVIRDMEQQYASICSG